jgi:hypothetical protein
MVSVEKLILRNSWNKILSRAVSSSTTKSREVRLEKHKIQEVISKVKM